MSVIRLSANTTQFADPSQQTYFVSDLHLDPARPDTIDLSLRFFAHVKGAQALFIIGDLFEYWLGDDAADPRLTAVYDAIGDVSASGTAIHLMHGNRDFLLGEQFANRVGATLHRDDLLEVDFGTVRYSLLHGDTLCTDDVDYLRLRSMVRNPDWQAEFLALSIEERIAKAQALREKSREATASKVAGIMDVNNDAVLAHCEEFSNDALIHGHTHRPFDHASLANDPSFATVQKLSNRDTDTDTDTDTETETEKTILNNPIKRRLVLGDWKSDHAMIARFDGQQLLFERYG